MAVRLKANIQYQPVVEQINRKFVPKKETSKAAGTAGPVDYEQTGWMGGATRSTYRAGLKGCSRNYLVVRANARGTQPSGDELKAREDFAAVSVAAKQMMGRLQYISIIQDMFLEGGSNRSKVVKGVSPYGYTIRGFVFAVLYAIRKEEGSSADLTVWPSKWDDGTDPSWP